MKGITIRFSPRTYELIRREAAHEGLNITAFIREAAYGRAVHLACLRGEVPDGLDERVFEAVRLALKDDESSS